MSHGAVGGFYDERPPFGGTNRPSAGRRHRFRPAQPTAERAVWGIGEQPGDDPDGLFLGPCGRAPPRDWSYRPHARRCRQPARRPALETAKGTSGGELGEPALDRVRPAGVGGGEVQREAG
jgi:hypothetical protein